ncbi:hypothetical protein GQ600_15623 [Phytophthora cactorum]|nr:hypothetical protein GQ600_15623 [Phytophthora cactorum]
MESCRPGQEGTVLAGTKVTVEEEEYDKELEERLIPLDEVELERRMKVNAETTKEPSLENMSSFLGIPVDVLERNRRPVDQRLTSPEYWLEWFSATLAKSDEAKRANRDFRKVATDNAEVGTEEALSGDESSVVSDNGAESVGDAAVEEVVRTNIVVFLEADEVVSYVAEVLPRSAPFGRKSIRQGTVKRVAREAVYLMLRELKFGRGETDGVTAPPSDTVEGEGVPPLRDKTPGWTGNVYGGMRTEWFWKVDFWVSSRTHLRNGWTTISPRMLL